MPNAVLTAKNAPGVTAKLVVKNLMETARFVKSIAKESADTWDEQYASANPGDTIYIKKPPRFTVGSNLDITSTIQDIKEEKVALVLNKVANVAFQMNSLETAYDRPIKYWNDNFVAPAVNAIAAEVERWALQQACQAVANTVGTAGTQPGAILDFLQAGEYLFKNLVPEGSDQFALINPPTNTKTVDARKGLFQSSERIKEQYERGYIGTGDGFDYMRSNLLPTVTNGTATGALTVTTTSVNGASTIALTGTGVQTIKAGQQFTIQNVFDVHPLTKQTLTTPKWFVATADATAVAGAYTVQISPAIYDAATGGSLQNVSALPVATATVALFGTAGTSYAQNLCYVPDAFRFVSVPLYAPKNRDFSMTETVDGISVRVLRDFDIRTSQSIMRFDILGGIATTRPEWGVRVVG
jgi:hypothetical protein